MKIFGRSLCQFTSVVYKQCFDIVSLTETSLDPSVNLNLEIKYRFYHVARPSRGGIVTVHVRHYYSFRGMLSEMNRLIEHMWLEIQKSGKIIIYKTNQNLQMFINRFEDPLSRLVPFLGDSLNIQDLVIYVLFPSFINLFNKSPIRITGSRCFGSFSFLFLDNDS